MAQIVYYRGYGNSSFIFDIRSTLVYYIDDAQKVAQSTLCLSQTCCTVASETQWDFKTVEYLQHSIIRANDITKFVGRFVRGRILFHKLLFLQRFTISGCVLM